MSDLNSQLQELEIKKCQLEIAHLSRPWFKDVKFLIPTVASLFLAYISYTEWLGKISTQETLEETRVEIDTQQETISKLIDVSSELNQADAENNTGVKSLAFQDVLNEAKNISSKYQSAKTFEQAGFTYLLNKEHSNALKSFSAAYKMYPEYHNVDEIRKLLEKNDSEETDWEYLYRIILKKYSWGMPPGIKVLMKAEVSR